MVGRKGFRLYKQSSRTTTHSIIISKRTPRPTHSLHQSSRKTKTNIFSLPGARPQTPPTDCGSASCPSTDSASGTRTCCRRPRTSPSACSPGSWSTPPTTCTRPAPRLAVADVLRRARPRGQFRAGQGLTTVGKMLVKRFAE